MVVDVKCQVSLDVGATTQLATQLANLITTQHATLFAATMKLAGPLAVTQVNVQTRIVASTSGANVSPSIQVAAQPSKS